MRILLICFAFLVLGFLPTDEKRPFHITEKPNILWITCEDISPYLGSYGFEHAKTPNLDTLAANGIRFTKAYANAPVCAVARSTILSGMYASTLGTHQMRSAPQLPESIPAYPKLLRESGYYCTNNVKTDYNSSFENDKHTLWDETSRKAHWKNRPKGKPFFSVFNITVTHESQLSPDRIAEYIDRKEIPENPRVDPEQIELPPYHPDVPDVRKDWARLHDLITLMDSLTGSLIQELEAEGVSDNTIIFFYSDHGGQLARSKRYIYNVGTQVPLIVHLPEKWKHLAPEELGHTNNELVSFVDLAQTVLSIAGTDIPEKMQGRIFLGKEKEAPPKYVHFYRDRMSERYDLSRAVTDGKNYFIRNFMPHRPRGRDTRYGYTVQANWGAWETQYSEGECNEIQSRFYRPKPLLELFNSEIDPWHVSNLVETAGSQKIVQELSDELDRWMIKTRDIGLVPEPMFRDLVGKDRKYRTIYEYAQSTDYPVEQILEVAKKCSAGSQVDLADYLAYLQADNPVIRYWGAYALFLTRAENKKVKTALKKMMAADKIAANRIMAAQALGLCGDPDLAFDSLMAETSNTTRGYVFLQGLNALQYSHTDDRLTREDWKRFKAKQFETTKGVDGYGSNYAQRIIDDALVLWPDRKIVD